MHDKKPWWSFGAAGAATLSIMTLSNVIGAALFGRLPSTSFLGIVGFAFAIIGMGFICGTAVWAAQDLPRKLGRIGDGVLGAIVLVVFFLYCMLIFARDLLWERLWVGGIPMLTAGVIAGALGGLWCGNDVRRARALERDTEQP